MTEHKSFPEATALDAVLQPTSTALVVIDASSSNGDAGPQKMSLGYKCLAVVCLVAGVALGFSGVAWASRGYVVAQLVPLVAKAVGSLVSSANSTFVVKEFSAFQKAEK